MATATIELEVGGMHCESCVALIEETLSADPAVSAVSVDLEAGRASVTFDTDTVSVHDLCGAVAGVGYEAAPLASGPTAS